MKKYLLPILFYLISSLIISIPLIIAFFFNFDIEILNKTIDMLKFKLNILTIILMVFVMVTMFTLDIFIIKNRDTFENNYKNITNLIGNKHNIFLNLVLSFLSGYFEELLFRCYLFLLLNLIIPNIFINITIISIIFGLLHITQKSIGVILSFVISIFFFLSILLSNTVIYAMVFHGLFNFIELSFIFPYQLSKFSGDRDKKIVEL